MTCRMGVDYFSAFDVNISYFNGIVIVCVCPFHSLSLDYRNFSWNMMDTDSSNVHLKYLL